MKAEPIAICTFCPGTQATFLSAGPSRVISQKRSASRLLATTVARFISRCISALLSRPGLLAPGRSGECVASITTPSH